MTEHLITHTLDDYWIVVRSVDGRPPYEQVGRKWPTSQMARAFYDTLVEPLREPSEAVLHGRLPIPAARGVAHPAPARGFAAVPPGLG